MSVTRRDLVFLVFGMSIMLGAFAALPTVPAIADGDFFFAMAAHPAQCSGRPTHPACLADTR